MSEGLSPCPKCGSDKVEVHWSIVPLGCGCCSECEGYKIECEGCDFKMENVSYLPLIEDWNAGKMYE